MICHDHLAYDNFLEASIPRVPPSPATAPETNDGTMRVKSVATLRVCRANSLVGDRMVAKVPFLWEVYPQKRSSQLQAMSQNDKFGPLNILGHFHR